MLCDAWQAKDSRIRVIHKHNEGSSYARKTGIENATAGYVTFVDADDWIDPDMYAGMMTALLSTGSDIAQCGVCEVHENGHMVHRGNEDKIGTFEIVQRVEGALLILEDGKWRSWMWNKIFKKQLFDHIVFPKGRGFGEDFITLELFHKAKQTVYLHSDYYFYLQRGGSITNSKSIPTEMKNQRDYFEAYYDRYVFVRQHPEYQNAMIAVKYMTICVGMNMLRNMMVHPQYFPNECFYEKAEQLCSIPLTQGDRLQRSIKMNLLVLKISPKIYFFLKSFYLQILCISNRLKITNRPETRSLADFFGW
jgi:glycosyltransferase involved in cell wall biosynthesis